MLPSHFEMLFGIWKVQSKKRLQFAASLSRQSESQVFPMFTALSKQGADVHRQSGKGETGFSGICRWVCCRASSMRALWKFAGAAVNLVRGFNSKDRHLDYFQRLIYMHRGSFKHLQLQPNHKDSFFGGIFFLLKTFHIPQYKSWKFSQFPQFLP